MIYYFGIPLFEYFEIYKTEMIKMSELIVDLKEGVVSGILIQQEQKQGVSQ